MTIVAEQPWYLAKTRLGKERLAVANLQREGFEVYLPLRLVKSRRDTVMSKPLFPRHVFFRVGLTGSAWRKVFSTIGIEEVYRSGDAPAIVKAKDVARIKAAEEGEGGLIRIRDPKQLAMERAKALFDKGARIRITRGPMEAIDAVFEEAVDTNRVAILVKLLGRETRVTLELEDIKSAD